MAKLLDFLVSGVPGAENGTAQFFVPGTTDPTQVFRDALAENDYPIGTANPLGLQGQLTVFAASRVRCVLTSSEGAVVFDEEVDISGAGLVDVTSSAFVDASGNQLVALGDVLTMAQTSFGGTNWRYLATAGETLLNYSDLVTGIQIDVRAFGALGDDATDNLDNFQRAIDFCASRGGGTVFIPGGTWRVRDVIVNPHSNVSLRGAGREATVIKVMGSGQGMRILGDYCVVSDLTLDASVFSNADFAMTVGGIGSFIERVNVGTETGNWLSGIDAGAATNLLIRSNLISHGAAGIGISLTARGGAGQIGIENNTISSVGAGNTSIDLQGAQQGVRIRDNVLIGSNYCVYVDAGFTGGKVLMRDNLLTPNTQGISFNLATNIGFEQSGNGRDYHAQIFTTTDTFSVAPQWLEQGAFTYYGLTGTATATLNIGAPTPVPGPYIGEQLERKVIRIHIHADSGASLTPAFGTAYHLSPGTNTDLGNFATHGLSRDMILTFAYSPELGRWTECGPLV